MRIGFFTDTYLPSGSGVETSIISFQKNLEKMGHRIYIFAPHFPGYEDKNPRVFRFRSVKVIKKPEMRFAWPFLPLVPFKKIMDLKIDIAHAHSPFSMGFLGKFISLHQNIPLVYTHHTHYPEYAKVYLKEKVIFPWGAENLISWYSNFSKAVIAPSLKIKNFLENYGVKRPIYVLPTGIDLDLFKKSTKDRQELRKKLGIAPETKILLYVGRMEKEKNIEFLIRAFRELLKKIKVPVILLMVGGGSQLSRIRDLADQLQISQYIHFAGSRIPRPKIPQYYQASDLFLFSSLTDTQGIVILEAIACGLPIVALQDDVFQSFIISGENGYLISPKSSPKTFSQKILKILNNSSLYQNFSQKSLEIASHFSEKEQTKKLLEIYKKLI